MSGIVKDSSIWVDPDNMAVVNRLDSMIRIGIVKGAFNDADTGELRYLVEIQSNAKKINMNCRIMRRFGGVYNYEDYINRGYKTNDSPDPVTGFDAKAGDAVLVGQFNGQGREGVILGGLTHAARETTIQASDGPQYDSEFNGIHTNINATGEWTLTFKGQPTNLSNLDNNPSGAIPPPTYDTTVGGSFMKFDATGGWTIGDNATSNPQSIFVDKANNAITTLAGTYKITAAKSATIDAPQVAIGHGAIELLDQLTQLIDAIGKLIPISPVGNCTELSSVPTWQGVTQIKAKINQIKGSLS